MQAQDKKTGNRLLMLGFFCGLSMAALILTGSGAQAQIIGNFTASLPADLMAKGDATTGFGFSALRHEDKLRMKRLRERYIELNHGNQGIVEIYDIDTPIPENENAQAEASEPEAAVKAAP